MSLIKSKSLTTEESLTLSAALPAHYERGTCFTAKTVSEDADRAILLSPAYLTVEINRSGFALTAQKALDLADADSWDSTDDTDYTVAANRAGVQFYIYACDNNGSLTLLISPNSTVPSGADNNSENWTYTNTRKIGGFHCLCANVGTITDHDLSGYVAGDILPASIWDLKHRPVCDPAGMTYCAGIAKWVDIYLASVSDEQLVSVNGGTIADGESSTVFDWYDFVEWLGRDECGKRLPTLAEFMALSDGSNQGTQYSKGKDPVTTGGHSDTAEQRMISNCGCEDCCGVMWQWLLETGGIYDTTATWVGQYDSARTSQRGQGYAWPTRGIAGGRWGDGAYCGSRGSVWYSSPLYLYAYIGARGVAEPL